MDFFSKQLESGYLQVNDLNKIVRECRTLANRLGFTLHWRIKKRTATALIKFNQRHIIWQADYTHELPHMVICLMYHGVYTELARREKENKEAALRMRQIEEEREKERRIANMPTWRKNV